MQSPVHGAAWLLLFSAALIETSAAHGSPTAPRDFAGRAQSEPLTHRASACLGLAERREPVTFEIELGGAPALVRAPTRVSKPPILLWHGFGPPNSERALLEALPLDDVPALKIYLGLPLFGRRAPPGGMSEVERRQLTDYATLVFEPAVVGAARELAAVVEDLRTRGCLEAHEAVGLLGFSAGGTAVLLALAERAVPISAAVTVNAPTGLGAALEALERATRRRYAWTPRSLELATLTDAVRRASDLARGDPPPALMLWHGAQDKVVGARPAQALHDALEPVYEQARSTDRLELMLAPDGTHTFTEPATLTALRTSSAQWFNRYLIDGRARAHSAPGPVMRSTVRF